MQVSIDTNGLIAIAALVLSFYATWRTFNLNRRQETLIKSRKAANGLLTDNEQNELLDERCANLGASFIALGSNRHRLSIWNQGPSVARNIQLEVLKGRRTFVDSNIKEKFPLETLEKHHSVELIAEVTSGTPNKHEIKLIWSDDSSEKNEMILYPSL